MLASSSSTQRQHVRPSLGKPGENAIIINIILSKFWKKPGLSKHWKSIVNFKNLIKLFLDSEPLVAAETQAISSLGFPGIWQTAVVSTSEIRENPCVLLLMLCIVLYIRTTIRSFSTWHASSSPFDQSSCLSFSARGKWLFQAQIKKCWMVCGCTKVYSTMSFPTQFDIFQMFWGYSHLLYPT